MNAATVPPMPGRMPKNDPHADPRRIGIHERRSSSRLGIIDRNVTPASLLLPTSCDLMLAITSETPNSAIATAAMLIPSASSGTPKLNLGMPV